MTRYNNLAILIPAFNEEKTILNVLTPLLAYGAHLVVVTDGCTDDTVSLISHLPITILQQSANKGKGACLQIGFSYLKERSINGIITLDADGQHDPHDIAQIIEASVRNPDCLIIGARVGKKKICPKYRYIANQMIDFIISQLCQTSIKDSQSGFRYYPHSFIRDNYASGHKRFSYESELLFRARKKGLTTLSVNIKAIYPSGNRKSYFAPIVDSLAIAFIIIKNLPFLLKNLTL